MRPVILVNMDTGATLVHNAKYLKHVPIKNDADGTEVEIATKTEPLRMNMS